MRYAQIRDFDISNGEGIGVALYTSGCRFRCKGCFNQDLWDLNGGKEWTQEIEKKFLNLINSDYIKRVSFLGGEPLIEENLDDISLLIKKVKDTYPNKKIWVYSGNTYENLIKNEKIFSIFKYIDILVDGPYVHEKRDLELKFKGSSNQRVIDIKKTIETGEISIYI